MEYDFTHKLLSAASKGHTNGAAMLIEHGVDVNLKDNDGMTALMWAAREGHIDTVAMLIDKGSDVNAKDNKGFTALTWAAMFSRTDIEALLIDKGADVNNSIKKEKFRKLSIASLEMTGEKGDDINAKDSSGWTALMLASENGHTEIVKLLIEKGAANSEKYSDSKKLSIAAVVTGIAALLFVVPLVFYCALAFDPYSGLKYRIIGWIILSLYSIFLPIPAIVCGSIDLKRIRLGRYSNIGKGFDITGIVLQKFHTADYTKQS